MKEKLREKKRIKENNYFLALAKKRKTTYEFTERKLPPRELELILEAGRWAPSCQNTQPWRFLVVLDKKKIEQLMKTANYGDFHTPPTVIIALLLVQKFCQGDNLSCFRGKDTGFYDSLMCIGMAGLNMVLQAADKNINSCLLTPHQQEVKRILRIRKEDLVPLFIGFGYQKKSAFQKKRERYPLPSLVSYEKFQEKSGKKERGEIPYHHSPRFLKRTT